MELHLSTPGPAAATLATLKDAAASAIPGGPSVTTLPPTPHPQSLANMDSERPAHPAQTLFPGAQRADQAARILASSSGISIPTPDSLPWPNGSGKGWPKFTGKLISLDLRGVDIRDFFRLIHRISGLNLVVDSDVTGKITLVLSDVPWDQALDLVLRNNDLGKVLEGNVLRIAREQTLINEAKQTQNLREAKLLSQPLVTLVRKLRYASAEDQMPSSAAASGTVTGLSGSGGAAMSSNLKPIPGVATLLDKTQGILSSRGSVVADPRDNAVIVTDVPSQMPKIEQFIDKLDTKTKQVSIQVRVVLASSDFTRTLSSILSTAFNNRSGSTQAGAGTGQNISGTSTLGAPALPPTSTLPGFGAFAITNSGARYILNATITAAEERDQARTLSRPTIVTQNNFPGMVMQGVQIPIQTTVNLTVSVQYVNAALQLIVTPQVTVDNKVFLTIFVNNASVGTLNTTAGPSINTQQATTQVLVPNGGTVVFGGINVTTRSRSANSVPLLGSIPVLGNLFKSSSVNDQNQELLFFVSPTVLKE